MGVTVRIVGDVHGKIENFVQLVRGSPLSLQLGDMGFHYEGLVELDANRHKFIPGNHDHYYKLPPHALGDWGLVPFIPNSFFVRGAHSIDRSKRILGRDWFDEEELGTRQGGAALEAYEAARPKYMFSHDIPQSLCWDVIPNYGQSWELVPSTRRLLQEMYEVHQPELWFFGHHHRNLTFTKASTTFRCLAELDYFDLGLP